MSRQKKQAKKIVLRKQVTATKLQGNNVSFTKKLTSMKKGRCVVTIDSKTGVRSRVSASGIKQRD